MSKKHQNQLSILIDGLLYTQHQDIFSAVDKINELLSKPELEIKVIVFVSIKNIFEILENQHLDEFTLNKISFSNNILVASLNRKYGRISENELNGKFLLIEHSLPYVYLAITEGDSIFVKDGLQTFLRKLYPKISFPFLKTEQIEQILKSLESKLENRIIRLKTVGSKSRITSQGARKKYESIRKWTDLTYAEAFEVVKENDEWITSISFQLFNHYDSPVYSTYITEAKLTRNGYLSCNREFKLFFNTVISDVCEIASNTTKLLNNRGRAEQKNLEVKPIFLEFDFSVFKDKEQNLKLKETLTKLTDSSLSVFHGNPYFHASLLDYKDGSSYEIWVLSDSRITIVPQMKASVASLERLCEHIFKTFREGTIRDFGEVYEL